jgi:hypothetical protein
MTVDLQLNPLEVPKLPAIIDTSDGQKLSITLLPDGTGSGQLVAVFYTQVKEGSTRQHVVGTREGHFQITNR